MVEVSKKTQTATLSDFAQQSSGNSHSEKDEYRRQGLLKPFNSFFAAETEIPVRRAIAVHPNSNIKSGDKQEIASLEVGQNKDNLKNLARQQIANFESLNEVTKEIATRGFTALFTDNKSQAIGVYSEMLSRPDSFWLRTGLSFAAQNQGYLEKFISNLNQAATQLAPSERKQLQEYTKALSECKNLNIENPFRFTPANLISIVNERLSPQTDKPLLVMPSAKSDWSGSLNDIDSIASKFREKGFRVQYIEIASDKEFVSALKSATNSGKYLANSICLSAHGAQTEISLSDEDPRFKQLLDSEKVITTNDKDSLRHSSQYLSDGASIILNVCSAGEGGPSSRENMANMFRELFPNAGKNAIFSLGGDGTIEDIKFTGSDWDSKVNDISGLQEDGKTPIKVYQAQNTTKSNQDMLAA